MKETDQFVLTSMPHFIAVHYQRMLEAETWPERTDEALRVFELGLRTFALGLVSQYLIRDAELFSDPDLNTLLQTKLPVATLGTWQEILFTVLRAYEGKRGVLFMPELYDFFWDTSTVPHQPRPGIQDPFTRLVQIRNDIAEKGVPVDDVGREQLGKETLDLLRTVSAQFAFLGRYELIRVTGRDEEGWHYECYSGLQIMTGETPLSPLESEGLKKGWFYLSKDRQRFLELHPLLIFWKESPQQLVVAERARSDVALYESFMRHAVSYLAATLWDHISTSETVGDFARRVLHALEKVKMERLETVRLTWWQLKRIAHRISEQRMGEARGRYLADLYLQRDTTELAFDKFLASDKACFVLTGKSGVGKSNFLLSLTEEYHADHPGICLLMYNGATLDPTQNLTAIVTADFENRLRLTGRKEEEGIDNIWLEIERVKGIEDRKVVLVIDAINENMDGKALLRQINELAESGPWMWLKMVVTSRPEAWRNIKRGVRLAEGRYYHEVGKEKLGFEMDPFTYSEELKPFERDELPRVYEKYCRVYDLRSTYTELPTELKEALRDPLMLRLVADIYRGQEIPRSIRAREIYKDYIDALIRTERVQERDVQFLEQELMPLMIGKKPYGNTIPGSVVATAQTSDGRRLYNLIHGEEVLSSGRTVNASYRNLADAEILERRGDPSDYEIGFKYERFYDYFAGKHFARMAPEVGKRAKWYVELIREIKRTPFIWGPVRQALLLEAESSNREILLVLAHEKQQSVRDLTVNVLIAYANDQPVEGMRLTENMLHDRDLRIRKMAVQVAGAAGISSILEKAGADRDSSLRAVAVQATYYFWQREPEPAWNILEKWAKCVRGKFLLPSRGLAETSLVLSMLIMTDYRNTTRSDAIDYQNPDILERLQRIWRQIMDDLLWVKPDSSTWSSLRTLGRELIVSSLVKFGLKMIGGQSEIKEREEVSGLSFLQAYFKSSFAQRQLLADLLTYLDDVTEGLEPIEAILVRAFENNEALPLYSALVVILLRSKRDRDQDLRVVERVFNRIFDETRPNLAAAQLVFNAGLTLRRDPRRIEDEAWEIYTRLQRRYMDAGGYYLSETGAKHEANYISLYAILEWKRYGRTKPTLFDEYVTRAARGEPAPSIPGLLAEIGSLAIVGAHPKLALEAARPLVAVEDPVILEQLGHMLARIQLYYQDLVEDFLEETKASSTLVHAVRSTTAAENMWSDFLLSRVGDFGAKIIFIPRIRKELRQILERALTERSLAGWLNKSIRQVVNFVYGDMVFREWR